MNDIITKTHYEEEGDTLIIERVQDCESIIKQAKAARDFAKGAEMWHVGKIPPIIVEKYCNQVGITFREFVNEPVHVNRILNDSDYAHFRVLE